jgi:hypothetical protein
MLKEIPKSDIVVRPFKVYKEWTLDESDIVPMYGTNQSASLYDSDTDSKNTNGISKRTLYDSVKAQFYLNPATSSIVTEVGKRESYASTNERVIGDTIGVISIPQEYYGEGVKVGSMVVEYGAITATDDTNSNLIDSASNIKGNIFYDRGLIVLTDGVVDDSTLSSFDISYRSTMTIYENEIFLSVNENEFNVSTNPTAIYETGSRQVDITVTKPNTLLVDNEMVSQSFYQAGARYIKSSKYPYVSNLDGVSVGSFDDYITSGSTDQTGSYLTPFITTIGLYDNELNMVAVAKLPQPIKSLPDYPVNFIVRFDT